MRPEVQLKEETISMTQQANSRRNFIKLAATGAAAGAISWDAASYTRIPGANDRISVGIVGFSERAMEALIPALNAISSVQNCEMVAVSDIWNRRREEGADFIGKLTGKPIAKARIQTVQVQRLNGMHECVWLEDGQICLFPPERIDNGRQARIRNPHQVHPVFHRPEGRQSAVLIRRTRGAEPHVVREVHQHLCSLLHCPPCQLWHDIFITDERTETHTVG